ncbi:MAG: hypothetical protein SWX82_09475 [Cyanobacteriota bacterium]|nr:hypothetical protein [Cyanobacteriota bacterium]
MTTVTPEEIAEFRSELANYPEKSLKEKALKELEVLERCNGNLEGATRVLARRAQESVLQGDSSVEKIREFLCQPKITEQLAKAQKPLEVFSQVAAFTPPPFPQAIATLMLLKMGVENFCNLDESNT